jgi:hypothetical protein
MARAKEDFKMGSRRIGLARTQGLIESLKRELSMGGTTFTNVVQQGTATSTAGEGAVSGTTTAPVTRVTTLNGEIITTITVDMQNLSASAGAAAVIIGNANGAVKGGVAALITWDDATNGICYKAEMSCLEVPAGNGGGNALDIDLMTDDQATEVQGTTAGGDAVIAAGGAWSSGLSKQQLNAPVDDGQSFYLTNGNTVGDTGAAKYTAGKFVIRLYGHVDF